MRRFIFPLLVFALAMIPLVSTLAEEGGPTAVVPEPVKDFETVAKGEKLTHAFTVRNEGQGVLEITDVRPACGCTVAEFDKTIAPGKTGKVSATVDTSNFNGPISKSIAVFTSDAANPKLQLVIRANVRPYIQVFPGYARYIYVQGEEVNAISQTLWAADGADLEILDVTSPYPHLKTSYREATIGERKGDTEGKQWRITVDLDPHSPIGPLRDFVEVKTDHPKQKSVRIPISGFVRPRQHVTPQEINFGTLDGENLPLQRTLTFTNFITAAIRLTDVETGYQGMTANVEEVGKKDGHRFKLVLTVGAEMPKGDFASTLMIHTSDEKNPIVEVSVKGTIL